jgi:hypothetical protein
VTGSKTVQEPEDWADVHHVGEQKDPAVRPIRRPFIAEYRALSAACFEAMRHRQKSTVFRRNGLNHSTVQERTQTRDSGAGEASRTIRRFGCS